MKTKILLTTASILCFALTGKAQLLETNEATNWNKIQKSGFYQILGNSTSNSPVVTNDWWWGISTSHGNNISTNRYFNSQIAISRGSQPSEMYFRNTTDTGEGTWARVLHNLGNQRIAGGLTIQNDLVLQTETHSTTPIGTLGKKLFFGNMYNDNGDAIYLARFNHDTNSSDLRINIGDDSGGDDRFVIGNIHWNSNNVWKDWFVVSNNGNVGIGVSNPQHTLEVLGTIRATEIKVETGWADFVFDKDYKLPSLSEVENHITTYKRLPEIPSESEVKENGVNLGEMQVKLLQKIEELTLYTIAQEKEIQQLKSQNETLKKQENRIRQLEEKLLDIIQGRNSN